MNNDRDALWGIVLAGGDGVRLQDLTRKLTGTPIPKQYCRITGDRSMLEATLARMAPNIPAARTLVVTNRRHLPLALEQTRTLPPENLLVQADNYDTGPGMLFGLLDLEARDPAAMVAVFPSDHFVRDESAFRAHVANAVEVVSRHTEKIVVLGIAPERADPSLGYLDIVTQPIDEDHGQVFAVAGFVEKPTTEVAARIAGRGGLWNSFIMVFRLDTMRSLLRRHRPADWVVSSSAPATPWNFSRDFLARIPADLLALRVADVGWSDWGTREAVERTLVSLRITPPWRAAADAA